MMTSCRFLLVFYTTVLVLLVMSVLRANATNVLPQHITVLTSPNFPINGVDEVTQWGVEITVYDLEAVVNIERHISAQLPGNEEQAQAVARRIVPQHTDNIVRAWQGVGQANKWQITKVPAIVFNGESVLYGETRLQRAITTWQQWRQGATRP